MKLGRCRRTLRMNRLLQPNLGRLMLSLSIERRIDYCRLPFRPAPNNGEIFFVNALLLHQQPESPGGRGRFGDEHEPAGFAVQPVDDRDLSAVCDFEGQQFAELFP